MTFIAAENEVSRLASTVHFPDEEKGAVFAQQKVTRIARAFPDESEALWTGIQQGTMTGEQYLAGWAGLIERMKAHLFFSELDEKLGNLLREQNNALAPSL